MTSSLSPIINKVTVASSSIKFALSTALTLTIGVTAYGHGSLEGSRSYQVRAAGPAGGAPASWNDSYYNWHENSNNFTTYNQPGFSYSQFVPDGTIHSGGKNIGAPGHRFAELNTPSAGWQTTSVSAGSSLSLKFLATAPHDPSFFEVFLTHQGFDPTTQSLGWGDLEYLGRWTSEAGPNQVDRTDGNPLPWGGSVQAYDWNIVIPENRSGIHSLVVVWQRDDPAGEAFFASKDLDIAAIPEPGTTALTVLSGVGLLALMRYRKRSVTV